VIAAHSNLAAGTLGALREQAQARLERAGADSPRLTALVLLEHVSGKGRTEILAHPERSLDLDQAARFQELVERRSRREPLAYILGWREFYGRQFLVTRETLIPRPETEGLVEIALRRLASVSLHSAPRLLDVGTGSGALAVTLGAERESLEVVCTDCSLRALRVARQNAVNHSVHGRIQTVACDLATAIQGKFTVVLANLPYIPTADIETLEPEVRQFEPRLALDGGEDGLNLLERLIADLPRLIEPGGFAAFEFGDGQADPLDWGARQLLPTWAVDVQRDAAGNQRFLVLDRPA
jgi:release factor glutamine methyltransferase